MDGLLCGSVVVDENDKPVVFVGAHQAAEFRAVVDESWGTPKLREAAAMLAHDEACRKLKAQGVRRFVALLEGQVGKGLARRMNKLRGWFVSRGIAMEKEV